MGLSCALLGTPFGFGFGKKIRLAVLLANYSVVNAAQPYREPLTFCFYMVFVTTPGILWPDLQLLAR